MLVCGRFPIRHSSNHHLVSVGFEGREKMRSKKVTIKSNQALPAAELMLCWYLSTDMKKEERCLTALLLKSSARENVF